MTRATFTFTSLGRWFGFVAPPLTLLLAVAGLTIAHLGLVVTVKRQGVQDLGVNFGDR